jgi:membrane-associated phospholipid phosphatase
MRIRILRVAILLVPFFLAFGTPGFSGDNTAGRTAVETVTSDFETFYLGRANLARLGIGIAAAAVPANTNVDRWIRDKVQRNLRSGGTDDIAKVAKVPGSAIVSVPVYIGAYGAGHLLRNPTVTEWSQRSFRATIVGAPALLVVQSAIGSDKPEDGSSHWNPFHSSNGVSGHAYIGAVPLITAAEMSESPYRKGLFLALSTLPGLSRINDDAHYFSQSALGWYFAYLGCKVVTRGSTEPGGHTQFGVAPLPGGVAITVHRDF